MQEDRKGKAAIDCLHHATNKRESSWFRVPFTRTSYLVCMYYYYYYYYCCRTAVVVAVVVR